MPKQKDNEKKIVKPEKVHHTPPELKSKLSQEVSDIINIKKDKQAKSEPEVSEVL